MSPGGKFRFEGFLQSGALRISIIYLVLGLLWIWFSDTVTFLFSADKSLLWTISALKGSGFIIVTAILLYFAIRHYLRQLEKGREQILRVNHKLVILNNLTRHDISNQLTAVQNYLDLVNRNRGDEPKVAEYLKKIDGSVQTLRRLVEVSSEYQDVGVNAPRWQDVNAVIERASGMLSHDGVQIVSAIKGIEICADPLFERVVFNLMDNAIRYGGKTRTIRFSSGERDGSLIIACEDDGNGIPPDLKEKILQRKYFNNTGLGLFLSREILSMTGMSIRECGEFMKGARFEITVPSGQFRTAGANK
jgi:signal transduction histidine kinase